MFIPRSEWGKGLDLDVGWRRLNEKPTPFSPQGIVLHHFEPTDSYNRADLETSIQRVRHWFAVHSSKWSDIGYHYLISPQGDLFEGRAECAGSPVQGAHAINNNDKALGVVLLGNYCKEPPAEAAQKALLELLEELCARYKIDPSEQMEWTYTAEDLSTKCVKLSTIVGHCDVRFTQCPGEVFYNQIDKLRQKIRRPATA